MGGGGACLGLRDGLIAEAEQKERGRPVPSELLTGQEWGMWGCAGSRRGRGCKATAAGVLRRQQDGQVRRE